MSTQLERLASGVKGLDAVLCGGFIEGASYIIQGHPGAGKTILANQIAFSQASNGRGVLYVTFLAESHERLFQSLSTLDFYQKSYVGSKITYVSVFQTLRGEGLSAVVELLRREMARQNPAMLIVDGLLNARDLADAAIDIKTFVAELQAHAAFSKCTVLLLTSASPNEASPEHTMVDGVVGLYEEMVGFRSVRRLQITKSRGSDSLRGFHQYEINGSGMTVYPRLETWTSNVTIAHQVLSGRLLSGVTNFDELAGGGFPEASTTVLMGPSGSGKTSFGLSYISLATREEPALVFGFYETPARLLGKARALGLDLEELVNSGTLTFIWHPLGENLLDKLAARLLDAVRERGVKRVFIDGFGGFERASVYPNRLAEFFACLTNQLRDLGATTLASWEMRNVVGGPIDAPGPEFSATVDNLLVLRQVEFESDLKRIIAIIKIRDGAFDSGFNLVNISDRGLEVSGRFDKAGDSAAGKSRASHSSRK